MVLERETIDILKYANSKISIVNEDFPCFSLNE